MMRERTDAERQRDMAFAKKLKQLMETRRLQKSELAAEIWGRYLNTEGKYISRGRDRISMWVNGKGFPDVANFERLVEALHVKLDDLR